MLSGQTWELEAGVGREREKEPLMMGMILSNLLYTLLQSYW